MSSEIVSSIPHSTEVPTVNNKREREEDGTVSPAAEEGAAAGGALSTTLPGRVLPPPLKIATTETSGGASSLHAVASPHALPPNAVPSAAGPSTSSASAAGSSQPSAPAPMVRIKSRASVLVSSPTTPAVAGALSSMKVASPPSAASPVPPTAAPTTTTAATRTLKIHSPTTNSPPSSANRFGSPLSQGTKSPDRYKTLTHTIANAGAAATAAALADPKTRFSLLLVGVLSKDKESTKATAEKIKEAADAVAAELMTIGETSRNERVKTILHHLSDENNFSLREEIRSGVLTANQLINMDVKDMLNEEKRAAVNTALSWAEKDRNLKELAAAKKISSAMYQCPKCKKRDCSFYEKQTRSADEPMTQFINCNLCKYNWKIY